MLSARTLGSSKVARVESTLGLDMAVHPLAGKPAPAEILIDPDELVAAYYSVRPDPENTDQQVSFGTSGHRGSPEDGSFNEAHILATTQAICEHRASQGISGPLYLGGDTHAASGPAERTALEVLAANGVTTIVQAGGAFTATPGISHAILVHNRGRQTGLADGIVVTPSHNPPRDGGFKYNPPHGGPADTDVTGWVQDRANALLRENNASVKRMSYEAAKRASTTQEVDFAATYLAELEQVVDLGCDPQRAAAARRRSLGRRERGLLVAHRRASSARHQRREPDRRPALRLHDRGSRREDPHGLLEPVRDGQARWPEGPVPSRLR